MSLDFIHEPLIYTSAKPVKLANTPWRDLNTPKAYLRLGMKRSGKGVTMDKDIYIFWKYYITCFLLHSAGGGENLYSIVNKNCKEKYDTIKSIIKLFIDKNEGNLSKNYVLESLSFDKKQLDLFLGLMKNSGFIDYNENFISLKKLGFDLYNGKFLHCQCHGTIPIIWMIPEWVKPKKLTFEWFNGFYFKTWQEYNQAYMNLEVNEYLPPEFFAYKDYKKNPLRKPENMIKKIKPLILTRPFTTPTTDGRTEIFREQFRKIALEARDEHRLVVNSPFIFPDTSSGRIEKFSTVAKIIDYIPELILKDFEMLKLDKPRDEWSWKEKSWHKIALFLGEVRELAPNAKLSPEKESSISKRALYGFMPKSRHQHCFVHMDLQSASDMFTGVRTQNDITILKRSTEGLLGDEYGWFYKKIETIREKIMESRGFTLQTAPFDILEQLNIKYPSVDEIPDNKGYIIYPNNEFRLVTFDMPLWHHKSDRDGLHSDTGLEWEIGKEKQLENEKDNLKSQGKDDKKFSKKLTDEDYAYADLLYKQGKNTIDIIKIMRDKDKNNGIMVDRFESANEIKNFNNKYNSWKKKQGLN